MFEETIEEIDVKPMPDISIHMISTPPLAVDAGIGTAQMYRVVEDFCALYRERQLELDEASRVIRETFWRLALAIGCRDKGTPARVLRIGVYAALLADTVGCPAEFCDALQQAALVRDIGMVGMQDQLSPMVRVFSDSEVAMLHAHPVIGYEMLGSSRMGVFSLAAEVALGHHERFDGSGYPHRLQGLEIPLSARLVSLAEYYERLSSERDYRLPLPSQDIEALINVEAGSRFDPQLVAALLGQRELLAAAHDALGEYAILLGDPAPAPDFWQQFRRSP